MVHARVMAAEVRDIEDLGKICNSVICEILEVRLEVLETFKGRQGDFVNIYAPIPGMCASLYMPGVDYVMFFDSYEGLIFPNDYSFIPGLSGQEYGLVEIRELTTN